MINKEKLIISACNYAREKINLDENFWVLISEDVHFNDSQHSGLYDKERFLIRFNQGWIKQATYEEILKCAFHEVFHAFQHQEIIKKNLGYTSLFFTDEEFYIMEFEFKDENYDVNKWETLLIEKQSEYFSEILYQEIDKNFKNYKNIITKYYNLFPNIY